MTLGKTKFICFTEGEHWVHVVVPSQVARLILLGSSVGQALEYTRFSSQRLATCAGRGMTALVVCEVLERPRRSCVLRICYCLDRTTASPGLC